MFPHEFRATTNCGWAKQEGFGVGRWVSAYSSVSRGRGAATRGLAEGSCHRRMAKSMPGMVPPVAEYVPPQQDAA